MATSGTVGQTTINTATVIEHALRRCGLNPIIQTPESIDIAKECLYLLLTHYANRGLNLWCVERDLIGYRQGQKEYSLPTGTCDVLNQMDCTPSNIPATRSGSKLIFDDFDTVIRLGVRYSVLPASDYPIEVSQEDVLWVNVGSIDHTQVIDTNVVYWYELDVATYGKYIRVNGASVQTMYASNRTTEIPITPTNRDTYQSFPNKDFQSSQVTSSYFNKTLSPSLTLWPVPDSTTKYMAVVVHRQIQDVGTLTQQLAIPQRWFEATTIQLAIRLALELPGVDPGRVKLLLELGEKYQIEAEDEETDSAPITLRPNISPYTR